MSRTFARSIAAAPLTIVVLVVLVVLGFVLGFAGDLVQPGFAAAPTAVEAADAVPARIAGEALTTQGAYDFARALADKVGARPAGSASAHRAAAWAEAAMHKMGLKNVRREPVQVPGWTRGQERGEILSPTARPLVLTALGGSVATPVDGITGEVVAVASLDDVKGLGNRARGKILFFNQVMAATMDFTGYAAVAPMRVRSAIESARAGAIATLVRSAGTGRHRLAHTGAVLYEPGVLRVPAAALAAEDADLLARLVADSGSVKVRLRISITDDGPRPDWNVVGELPGNKEHEQIVLIGAHLDSWDLGAGALDDGAGCGIALDTLRIITTLGLKPARTIRVVLFASEENDGAGALGYVAAHKAELPRHVAALEADAGAGRPTGYQLVGDGASVTTSLAMLQRWVAPLANLVPPQIAIAPRAAPDIVALHKLGVPAIGVSQDMRNYFEWHHTHGDTVDKIDRLDLALTTAAFATLTWTAATATELLPRAVSERP